MSRLAARLVLFLLLAPGSCVRLIESRTSSVGGLDRASDQGRPAPDGRRDAGDRAPGDVAVRKDLKPRDGSGCSHSPCVSGAPLSETCDPAVTCTCTTFPACCTKDWDWICASEAANACKAACAWAGGG